MTGRIVAWDEAVEPMGDAVVAIGVFDGVHIGHRELLQDTVAEARRLGCLAVAVTFDRDPDQVVTPEAAAPQLLTLEDKCRFILELGIDIVLIVGFTREVAEMASTDFLSRVLGGCCEPVAIHVGADFRFGARAAGTVETLSAWAAERGARVRPHPLVEHSGEPVSSTRIRRLVASGDVVEAAALLGRATRVTGRVHLGREEGRQLGFPTANVIPVEYAALPADGVYAGRVQLRDGATWPAAISVGVPPTFPDARDYVEAHLIGFEGDLYGEQVTLEFLERLREQRAFGSLPELTEAIGADVARAAAIASAASATEAGRDGAQGFELNPAIDLGRKAMHSLGMDVPLGDLLDDGSPVVEDPEALAAAERAVSKVDPSKAYDGDEEWVELVGPRRLSGLFGDAGFTAALVAAPLQAAEIPFIWDPYPPEQMPSFRPYYGVFDRRFRLLVPANRLEEAQKVFASRF